MEKIKLEVQKVIDTWYKNVKLEIIHFWEQDDTWFLAIKHWKQLEPCNTLFPAMNVEVKIDFVRLFPSYRIPGEYHISIDKTIQL